MKRLAALVLILCVLLSACAENPVSDHIPSDDVPSGGLPTDVPFNYVPPDYSTHWEAYENEEIYMTGLAGLNKLSQGERAVVY